MRQIASVLLVATTLILTSEVVAESAIQAGFNELVEFRTEDVSTESTNNKFGAHAATVPGFAVVSAPFLSADANQEGGVFLFRMQASSNPPVSFVKQMDRLGPIRSVGYQGEALAAHGDWIAIVQNRPIAVTLHHRDEGGPDNWGLAAEVLPPDDPTYKQGTFGGSSSEYPTIDIHGDLLIVSDYGGDLFDSTGTNEIENRAGFAFIFERNHNGADGWALVARLEDPTIDPNDNEEFGRAVAIWDGHGEDVAVVGAPSTDVDDANRSVGVAYVFTRPDGGDSWSLTKTLFGEGQDGRQASDEFGRSVDIDGETIAVGTSNGANMGSESNAGSVHLYYRDTEEPADWGEVIEQYDGNFIDNYSRSIELRGDQLIVGAPGAGPDGRGVVYFYERNKDGDDAWGLQQELTASLSETRDEFGSSVSLLNGFAVVGDRGRDSRDGSATRSGSAYLFLDDLIFCDNFESD